MDGLQGYVMRKPSRVICPHAVMLAHSSKAELQTEEIMSAPKNVAIYASSFFYPLQRVAVKGSFFGPLQLGCWFLLLACPVTVLRLVTAAATRTGAVVMVFLFLPHFSFFKDMKDASEEEWIYFLGKFTHKQDGPPHADFQVGGMLWKENILFCAVNSWRLQFLPWF